jgi:pyruvate-ferredoxin/flavodoxin oxidoreductase
MRLGRSKSKREEEARFPGYPHALDGHAAAYAVETLSSDAVVVQSAPDMAEITGPLRNLSPAGYDPVALRPPAVRHVDELRPLLAQVAGYAASGSRTAALVTGLAGARDALCAAAGERLAFVLNLTCRAVRRQAGSLHGGHDDYHAAAAAGVFEMFAKNPQEAADFALIAHRTAEFSLTPGVCAQDFYQTSQSVQNVNLPEHDLVETFLGRAGDLIDSPTPAQRVLYGPKRRRVPALVDSDHPAGIGGVQNGDAYYKAVVAQHPFFSRHLEAILEQALAEWGDLTGRRYAPVSGYRTDDADYVVLAQGAVVEALEAVVDHLRETARMKVGVVNVSVFRPFPGARLTRLLKGKKAVTVLERTDQSLAEDLPLSREFRSAIDKALEAGGAGTGSAEMDGGYEPWRAADRPRVYTGIYGVGGALPTTGELRAVFENMAGDGKSKDRKVRKRFYLGADFARPTRRFPHLQSLQQQLRRDYPDLDDITLPASASAASGGTGAGAHSLAVHSLSIQGGVFAGNLFAQVLASSFGRRVRTFPEGGLDPGMQPACFTLSFSDTGRPDRAAPESVDALLVSGEKLLEFVASRAALRKQGTIVVGSNREREALWNGISRRTRRWIREREARVHTVDAERIASQAASRPSFTDQLTVWALLGAFLRLLPGDTPETDRVDPFAETLRSRLEHLFGEKHYLVDDITAALQMGFDDTSELDWRSLPAEPSQESEETEAPWTVQQAQPGEGAAGEDSVFDPVRFWRSVGYLYDVGQPAEALIDPYVATGIVPGGSSAYRDMSPYRLGMPRWLPENCTGCGLCWAHCPDSALPPTVYTAGEVIKHAMKRCEAEGATMVQMQRVADHLAKQAYRVAGKDDLCQHRTMGALLREAFEQLAEKMKLDEEKLRPLQAEFDGVVAKVEHWPIARTERFFDGPHTREKGSGRLLSISLNPLSCKGCNLCVAVCPDEAMAWENQTVEALETARTNWEWQMSLPAVSAEVIDAHVDPGDVDTEVNRLLDKRAYHSLVGGDAAAPGQSVKTAVHLVTGAVESVMRRRYDAHVEKLTSLIERVEDKIQGRVAQAVEINDFDSFGRQLDRLGKKSLTPEELARLAGDDRTRREIDPAQLMRLGEVLVDLKEQHHLYTVGAGGGRARMILTIDPGGSAFWSGTYPDNPHTQPWVSQLPGDAPALAEGVFEALSRRLSAEFAACRRAELELDDAYDPREHDAFFRRFDWQDFTKEERELVPPVLVLGYTGITAWDDVFRLLARRFPVKVVVVNTGAMPLEAASANENGLSAAPADRPVASSKNTEADLFALARRGVYVLQSTVGHPGHLIRGVVTGLSRPYPALFHVHAPDPQSSGIAPEKVAEEARLAYESRAFPLFVADPDAPGAMVGLEGNPDPDRDWAARELVYVDASGREEKLEVPATVADWALGQSRFLDHFTLYSKGYLNDKMKLLPEYLAMAPDERAAFEPIIHAVDDQRRHVIAVVSPAIIRAEEERQRYWKYLRELAAGVGAPARAATAAQPEEQPAPAAQAPQAPPPPQAGPELDQALHEKLTEKLLWLSGFSQDPDFFKQSLREFLVRQREAGAAAEGGKPDTAAD